MKTREAVRLACIGGGKMGEALIRGLLGSGAFQPDQICVADPDPIRREVVQKACGVRAYADSREAVRRAGICLLAVKPQDMETALLEITESLPKGALVVSIAAGITTDWLQERLGPSRRIVRAMPNAPALVRKGTTGLYFGSGVEDEDKKIAVRIFETVGISVVVEKEDHLNLITGLSGSGPGYVFLFLEALTDAGVYLGLPRDLSARLALHTVLGSAHMAMESDKSFVVLKEMITSPGGTTIAALKVMEEGALRAVILRAVEAASQRSRDLAR